MENAWKNRSGHLSNKEYDKYILTLSVAGEIGKLFWLCAYITKCILKNVCLIN